KPNDASYELPSKDLGRGRRIMARSATLGTPICFEQAYPGVEWPHHGASPAIEADFRAAAWVGGRSLRPCQVTRPGRDLPCAAAGRAPRRARDFGPRPPRRAGECGVGLDQGYGTTRSREHFAPAEEVGDAATEGRGEGRRGASHPVRSRPGQGVRSVQPIDEAERDCAAQGPAVAPGSDGTRGPCQMPMARAVRNSPVPSTKTPVIRAMRSPAGARRSRLMAAVVASIPGQLM